MTTKFAVISSWGKEDRIISVFDSFEEAQKEESRLNDIAINSDRYLVNKIYQAGLCDFKTATYRDAPSYYVGLLEGK